MLDKIFYVVGKSDMAPVVIAICFIPLLVDRYYDRLLPLSGLPSLVQIN